MNINLLLSVFFSLFPLIGALILVLRDKSWPVILLLLGSVFNTCVTLLLVLHGIIGGGGPGSYAVLGVASFPGRLLFGVGFLAYALKKEHA